MKRHDINKKYKFFSNNVHNISTKLGLSPLQIKTLIDVYFNHMLGVGGVKSFWFQYNALVPRQSLEDRAIHFRKNVNPARVTQKQLTEFYSNMTSTQRLSQRAYKKPRASRVLANAGGPRRIMAFDAGAVTTIKYNNYAYVVVLVDTWSRFIFAKPIKIFSNRESDDGESRSKTGVKGHHIAKVLGDMLSEVVEDYGSNNNLPNQMYLISDNGKENDNNLVRDMLSNYPKVKHSFVPPHTPSANARAESGIKLVKRALLEYTQRVSKNWVKPFQDIVASINRRYSRPINMSPFDAFSLDNRVETDRKDIDMINERINKLSKKQMSNEVSSKDNELDIGDHVLLVEKIATKRVPLRKKFIPLWKPHVYTIHQIKSHKVSSVPPKYILKKKDSGVIQKAAYFREDLQKIDIDKRFDIKNFGKIPESTQFRHEEGHIIGKRTLNGATQYKFRYNGYNIDEDVWIDENVVESQSIKEYEQRNREIIQAMDGMQ